MPGPHSAPVTASVASRAIPDHGGFDANGAWHDGGNGRFAKPGWSTAKAAVLKLVRGAAARDLAKKHGGKPVTVPFHPDTPTSLRNKFGDTPAVTFHSNDFAALTDDGRRVLVPWKRFSDPPTVQQLAAQPKLAAPQPLSAAAWLQQTKNARTSTMRALARQLFDHDLGDGYRSEVTRSEHLTDDNGMFVSGHIVAPDGESVGWFDRKLMISPQAGDGNTVTVDHSVFRLAVQHQQRGIGTRMFQRSVEAYRAADIDEIRTLATSGDARALGRYNGAYVWARAGFDWAAFRDAKRVGVEMLKLDENSTIGDRLVNPPDGTDLADLPTPNDVALDPVGKQVLLGTSTAYWGGRFSLRPDTPRQAEPTTQQLATATRTVPDVDAAVATLAAFHRDDLGANTVPLRTLPTFTGNGDMTAAQQLDAINDLFNPAPHPTFRQLPVLDTAPPGTPLGMIAVNTKSAQIIGAHAPYRPDSPLIPPGDWVAVAADDPAAVPLINAAFLASTPTQRYLLGEKGDRSGVFIPGLLDRMRRGETDDNTPVPGLVATIRNESDRLAAPYTDQRSIPMSARHDPDGMFYVPDPDGDYLIDGDAIWFADQSPDGTTRLWVDPDAVDLPAAPTGIDYSTATDPDIPWVDRVAALAEIRATLADSINGALEEWLPPPNPGDIDDLVAGNGGDRELERLAAIEQFGTVLHDLVVERRNAAQAADPRRDAIIAQLRAIPGVPEELVALAETEPWASIETQPSVIAGTPAINLTRFVFDGHPNSSVMLYTPPDGPAQVAWFISGEHRYRAGDRADGWPTNTVINVDRDALPEQFHTDVHAGTSRPLPTDNSPMMQAWLDTMEALGIDMGTDPDLIIGSGRDLAAESVHGGYVGSANGNPTRFADLNMDTELGRTVDVGLRAYPKAWTTALRTKMQRVSIDPTVASPVGASTRFKDAHLLVLPSIDTHPEFKDVATHEFGHSMEHTIGGLLSAETWHFIRRLRAEKARTGSTAVWDWHNGVRGLRDDWGDEYAGRLYTGNNPADQPVGYEMLATASQYLHGHVPRSAADTDPDLLRWLMGLMAVVEPPEPETVWSEP